MIQHVSRNNIDIKKYDSCIENAVQSRVFAYSWYLDIVSENWDVLVFGDYEAVMPLPWKQKYFIKYITQPFFTQQLGVFSKLDLTIEQVNKFINSIPKKFIKVSIQLNSENKFKSKFLEVKNNYILKLDADYTKLFKNFSKGRKHAILQGEKNKLNIEEVQFKEILTLSKNNYSFKELSSKEFQKISKLVELLKQKEKATIIGVKVNNELIGGAVFIFDSKRILYLFSAISQKGKEMQVGSLLLNSIMKKNSPSLKTLDFEGSMIPGVAAFFKSFGAINESYFFFKKELL